MNGNGHTFRIRPMKGRDIPAVVSLDRLVFRDPWPESAYVQELYFNPNAHYFVLELVDPAQARSWHDHRRREAGRLLGFVGMRVEGKRGHISTLAVRFEWRGQQLGEVLLLIAIDQAIRDGAHVLGLEVRLSNEVAQGLYAKYDFEVHSRLHRYYADGEDAYYLQTRLKGNSDYRARVQDRLDELVATLQIKWTHSNDGSE